MDYKQLMSSIAVAYNCGDADQAAALFTKDCHFEDVATGHIIRGSKAVAAYCRPFFSSWPDLRLELVSQIVDGQFGSQEWVMSGTHVKEAFEIPPSGRKFSVRGLSFYEFKNDLIHRSSDYFDLGTLLRQISP